MEEDIKILETQIQACKECKFATCEQCEISYTEVKAIENLIARNKELEEENKGLKIELEIKKYCKVDELSGDLIYYKNLAKEYQGSSISKSKIKEKIKRYEWAIEHYDCDEADYKQSQDVGAWNALQQLLED